MTGMDSKRAALSRLYRTALRKHMAPTSASACARAARGLARRAETCGLAASDVARIHNDAVLSILDEDWPVGKEALGRAGTFLLGVIAPVAGTRLAAAPCARRLAEAERRLRLESARREALALDLKGTKAHYARLLAQSNRMQLQLKLFSHRILHAQEEERKAISRQLHDEIAQTLAAITVQLTALNAEATSDAKDLSRKIEGTRKLVERSVDIVHRFARGLRPTVLDDLGLVPALQSYLKEFTRRTRIPVALETRGAVAIPLADRRIVLYRVVQSALANVARHAKASNATVSIAKTRGGTVLEVRDDGVSFDVERVLFATRHRRLGILGMRERVEMVGGTFAIESARGAGTVVRVLLPARAKK